MDSLIKIGASVNIKRTDGKYNSIINLLSILLFFRLPMYKRDEFFFFCYVCLIVIHVLWTKLNSELNGCFML